MKRFLAILLCLLLPAVAFAAVRMPADGGVLTDNANVLSQETAGDITQYAARVLEKTGLELKVVTVHFLDGEQPQNYADALLKKWNCSPDTVLLLGAAGEDHFAVTLGENAAGRLGGIQSLLYTSSDFSELFRNTDYNGAMRAFFTAFNALASKQYGKEISLSGLFGSQPEQLTSGADSQQGQNPAAGWMEPAYWSGVVDSVNQNVSQYIGTDRDSDGMTPVEWILVGVLVLIVLSQSDPVRKRRERGGCLARILKGGLFAFVFSRIFRYFRRH